MKAYLSATKPEDLKPYEPDEAVAKVIQDGIIASTQFFGTSGILRLEDANGNRWETLGQNEEGEIVSVHPTESNTFVCVAIDPNERPDENGLYEFNAMTTRDLKCLVKEGHARIAELKTN